MPGKELDIENGGVQDTNQQDCETCLIDGLPSRFEHCPYCGTEL